jgi:HEAT repeat protein/cyclophilin family peptidyl-prolyl cis-trans isomerase
MRFRLTPLRSLLAPAIVVAGLAASAVPAPSHAVTTPREEEAAILRLEGARDTTGLAALTRPPATPAIRARAARALGHIGERGSVPALLAALRDASPLVRREAAFAVGLAGDSTAAGALGARLASETDAPTRVALVTALGYLGSRAAVRPVAASVRSSRPAERQAAALAAARLRDSTLVAPLLAVARDTRAETRWRVAYALGRIGDARAAKALRTLSYDKDAMVRSFAARALGEIRDSTAAARLGALMHDPAWRVRVNAAAAIGALGVARETRTLLPHLVDPHPHVRWQVAVSLGQLGDSAAAPALAKALEDSSTGVVQGAAIALLKMRGDRAVPAIAGALDLLPSFLRGGLADALGDVAGPAALEVMLARAAQTSDPPQAAGAISALARRPEAKAKSLPVIRPLLQDKDFTVVCSAAEALGAIGDSTDVPAIAALLSRRNTTQDDDVRTSAATALAALKGAAALDAVRGARRDPDRRVREIAARALGWPADSIAGVTGPALKTRATPRTAARRLTATVTTERGAITLSLDPAAAPENVENFAALARVGYFDGIMFHRVVPNFVIQAGCPRGDGWGGPGHAIPCEYNDKPYEVGTVGMALSGKDTGGSQWFITLSPQPRLEGRYTVLGKVTEGMDVAERIMPGDRIVKIVIR